MFKGIFIGDAYGAGFEFKNSMLVHNDGQQYYNHPTHMASDGSENSLRAGQYTDDTQMSIAVAETLLGDTLEQIDFANSFVDTFKRDPRKGYASGFYHFLMSTSTGEEFIKNIRPNSEKNGSAMRSVPLGVIRNIDELKRIATIQASLTHATHHGINASILVALMAHYMIYNLGEKKDLPDFLSSHFPEYDFKSTWNCRVPCHGISTVLAVNTVIQQTDSMLDTFIKSVAFGGDTDSVASIAGGIQDLYLNKVDDIPQKLIDDAENTNYGLDYCLDLEKKLFKKYKIDR